MLDRNERARLIYFAEGTVKLMREGMGKRRSSSEPRSYAAALAPVTSAQIAKARARAARYSVAVW